MWFYPLSVENSHVGNWLYICYRVHGNDIVLLSFWDISYFTVGIFGGKALDVFIDFEH